MNFVLQIFKSLLGKTPTKTSTSSNHSKHLQPILLEDKGYYQLGPDGASAEIFSLSITICSAKNLIHVRINLFFLFNNFCFLGILAYTIKYEFK
jgi:hypothetical protein